MTMTALLRKSDDIAEEAESFGDRIAIAAGAS